MNYIRIYFSIIQRAKGRKLENTYTEKHHIFPVSIFGENNKTVDLTFREHYIAHLLLIKIFSKRYGESHQYTRKMYNAIHRMVYSSKEKLPLVNSRMIEIAKIAARKSKIGKPRPDMKGKAYFGASEETIKDLTKRQSEARRGKHTNYPKTRKPLSNRTQEVFDKISKSRQKTIERFSNMSETEFSEWLNSQNKFSTRKNGTTHPNSNITRVLIARNIPLCKYYKESDFSEGWWKKSKNQKLFYGL